MKDKFKKGDLVVVLLHDHGSRYVGKLYNDEWMRERGWLDTEPTAKMIIEMKQMKGAIMVEKNQSVAEVFALMKENDISQMPVEENNKIVGSITEHGILTALVSGMDAKNVQAGEIMTNPFPTVGLGEKAKDISKRINKQNSAVLVRDTAGVFHVITEYDLIDAMAG